jgi:hypothetical protein
MDLGRPGNAGTDQKHEEDNGTPFLFGHFFSFSKLACGKVRADF